MILDIRGGKKIIFYVVRGFLYILTLFCMLFFCKLTLIYIHIFYWGVLVFRINIFSINLPTTSKYTAVKLKKIKKFSFQNLIISLFDAKFSKKWYHINKLRIFLT